jgi:hypothetical protein
LTDKLALLGTLLILLTEVGLTGFAGNGNGNNPLKALTVATAGYSPSKPGCLSLLFALIVGNFGGSPNNECL